MADDADTSRPRCGVAESVLRVLRLLLRLLSCALAAATIAFYLAKHHVVLDLLSHFQLQYLVAGVLVAAALIILRSRCWAIVPALAAVSAAVAIVPWYVPPTQPDGTGERLRVMQFNILESNDRFHDVVREVRRHEPDIIVFQEVDQRWNEGLEALSGQWPHSYFQPGTMLRGNLVISRHRLSDVLIEPSIGDVAAPSMSLTLHVTRNPISVLVGHTTPPHDTHYWDLRNRELLRLAERAREMPQPVILIGDLNTSMWSPHYRRFERQSGLVNTRRGFGLVNTFPMDSYPLLRVPLDHCLVSPEIEVLNCTRGEACGSDHAPLIVDLRLPNRP